MNLPTVCERCGQPMTPRQHGSIVKRYCSDRCARAAHRARKVKRESVAFQASIADRRCLYCGAAVVQKGRGRPRKFCTLACTMAWDYDRQLQRGRIERARERATRPPKPLIDNVCEVCGEPFRSKQQARFCSGRCALRSWRNAPEWVQNVNCPNCGKPVTRPIQVGGLRKFCSDACKAAYHCDPFGGVGLPPQRRGVATTIDNSGWSSFVCCQCGQLGINLWKQGRRRCWCNRACMLKWKSTADGTGRRSTNSWTAEDDRMVLGGGTPRELSDRLGRPASDISKRRHRLKSQLSLAIWSARLG